MADTIKNTSCWICGREVSLNVCKTDDNGHAVHEECYVACAQLENESHSACKNRGYLTGT